MKGKSPYRTINEIVWLPSIKYAMVTKQSSETMLRWFVVVFVIYKHNGPMLNTVIKCVFNILEQAKV